MEGSLGKKTVGKAEGRQLEGGNSRYDRAALLITKGHGDQSGMEAPKGKPKPDLLPERRKKR